jgi:tetratricopeptide (TPR) repeat protein
MGTVLLYIGAAYCRLGDTERGLGDIRRGLDIWRSTSNRFHMSYHLSDFADCLLRAKKYDEADRALREAEQLIAETDERSHVGEVLRLRGLLQILSGDVGDGAAKLWQAVKWARSRDARLFELRALRDLTLSETSQDEKKKAADWRYQTCMKLEMRCSPLSRPSRTPLRGSVRSDARDQEEAKALLEPLS